MLMLITTWTLHCFHSGQKNASAESVKPLPRQWQQDRQSQKFNDNNNKDKDCVGRTFTE